MHKYKVIKLRRTVGTLVNVYEAVQPELERRVELRLLNAMFEEGSDEPQRFEREFKAIARLDHPNIIKVYDWGQADKRLYYITELKNAQTLQALLETGRAFPVDEALGIGLELAGALAYLHERGILHRGLAADSVLYDTDSRRPVISEFTVVKDVHRSDLTARGVGHLTPMMTTPETMASQEADARVDIYLLGALLYKLLTNGGDPQLQASREKHVEALDGAGVPGEVAEAIARAIAYDREERQPAATELASELKEAREKLRLAEKRSATRRTKVPGDTTRSSTTRPTGPVPVMESGGQPVQPQPSGSAPVQKREPGRFADVPISILAVGIGLPLLLVLALAWLAK